MVGVSNHREGPGPAGEQPLPNGVDGRVEGDSVARGKEGLLPGADQLGRACQAADLPARGPIRVAVDVGVEGTGR
jgi:hypothetical protein